VLDPVEKTVFERIVTQLRAEDPQFVRRIDKLGTPRRRLRTAVAVLLWTFAPLFIAVGGWTGFFVALVAVGYAARIFRHRDSSTGRFWWWPPVGHRPGASP